MSDPCPCGSGNAYEDCCGRYHDGADVAPTAEALMRARYSAYARGKIDFLVLTVQPKDRLPETRRSAKEWAQGSEWLGLEILGARGGESDTTGQVEFIARFRQGGVEHAHHEVSRFQRKDGRWLFIDGRVIPSNATGAAVPRSAPCPCGSGKKYTRCCGVGAPGAGA